MVPQAKFRVGHGQMHEHELEDTMVDFIKGQFDVLVCTTIVESGVDIRNANTIFINQSDRFGLADLYQLRGRVGRYKHRAFAYFLVDQHKTLTLDARQRLEAIKEFNTLGAGYRLALRDLEMRGAGNILGAEQHGYIVKIGFDMYCSLLRKYVKKLQGEDLDVNPCTIDLKMDFSVDETYIPNLKQRMEVYRKIAQVANEQEVLDVENDIKDMYGQKLPEALQSMIELSKLKVVAGRHGYSYIGLRGRLLDRVKDGRHFPIKLPQPRPEGMDLMNFVWGHLI